jgi:hypothetical protein
MAGDICDACGARGTSGVCSSSFGAVSFAFCDACLLSGREPWFAVVGGLAFCGGPDGLSPAECPAVLHQCKLHKKTWEELWAEVRRLEDDYEREMQRRGG